MMGGRCLKPAKVQRDGKWFCTIHDPERVKSRQAKREATWDRTWEIESAERALKAALIDGGELLADTDLAPWFLPESIRDAAKRIQSARQAMAALKTQEPDNGKV